MEQVWQDLRFGLRTMAKSPGFTAIALLTLALGIGANTAIFSVVNSLLLRPPDYRDPDRLVMVWENNRLRSRPTNVISPANFLDWRDQNTVFEQMALFMDWRANLTGSGEPEEVPIQIASVELFPLLGVQATVGRVFAAEEGQRGKHYVALLGDALWRNRFGADRNIVGRHITLNNESYTVVGVLPPGFQLFIRQGSLTSKSAQLWIPYAFTAQHRIRGGRSAMAMARLKPGVTLEKAQAEMSAIAARFEQQYPDFNTGWGVNVVPLQEQFVGDVRPAVLMLAGAVAFVLLIACANVANLLLARAASRQREMAIRTALGAGRGHIIRQLLTESLLLALLAGAAGLLLAFWGVDALKAAGPPEIADVMSRVAIDPRVLLFTALASLGTGVLFGMAPAVEAMRTVVSDSLKEGGRGQFGSRGSRRVRSVLVVTQLALALVLMVGAGLLIKSFGRLMDVPTGFDPNNLLSLRLQLANPRYDAPEQRTAFFRQVVERIQALPGVRSAGAIAFLPLTGLASATRVTVVGRPAPPPGQELVGEVRVVDPDYFRTMNVPVLQGRNFNEREATQRANVVIVNATLAREYFPDESPLGKRLVIAMSDKDEEDEIIGVVGDVRHFGPETNVRPMTYWPYPRFPYPFMTIAVRTEVDPMSLAAAVRNEIHALDKEQPIADMRTMETLVAQSVARPRFNMLLLGIFAAVAMVLAAVGIYGVMAYAVTQRTQEIGIRMALGAQRGDILRLVARSGLALTVAGLILGLAGAFAVTRFVTRLLFGVAPTDPATFGIVAAVLALVSLLACWVPARRATRVDPMTALRYE